MGRRRRTGPLTVQNSRSPESEEIEDSRRGALNTVKRAEHGDPRFHVSLNTCSASRGPAAAGADLRPGERHCGLYVGSSPGAGRLKGTGGVCRPVAVL